MTIYEECDSGLKFGQIRSFIKCTFGELNIQIIKTKRKIVSTKGIIFDFVQTQKTFLDVYRQAGNSCNILVTDKIFATLDDDKYPHIRSAIYSFPSIISLSGIVEGPAKPKEFYLYKQRYAALGAWDLKESRVKRKFREQFIDYQDQQMTEVVKGYIAQAAFFYMTGNPFCERKACRLFNAHWQRDLIYAQITSGAFCKEHNKVLSRFKKTRWA